MHPECVLRGEEDDFADFLGDYPGIEERAAFARDVVERSPDTIASMPEELSRRKDVVLQMLKGVLISTIPHGTFVDDYVWGNAALWQDAAINAALFGSDEWAHAAYTEKTPNTEFTRNPENVARALARNAEQLRFMPDALRADAGFLVQVFRGAHPAADSKWDKGLALEFADPALWRNFEVVRAAVGTAPEVLDGSGSREGLWCLPREAWQSFSEAERDALTAEQQRAFRELEQSFPDQYRVQDDGTLRYLYTDM